MAEQPDDPADTLFGALKHLTWAVKVGRTHDITDTARAVSRQVADWADRTPLGDEDAKLVTGLRAGIADTFDALMRAVDRDDHSAIVSLGELVGDAVANLALLLAAASDTPPPPREPT